MQRIHENCLGLHMSCTCDSEAGIAKAGTQCAAGHEAGSAGCVTAGRTCRPQDSSRQKILSEEPLILKSLAACLRHFWRF